MSLTALPADLDPLKLRAQLASALAAGGWDAPSARSAALAHLKAALAAGHAHARARLIGISGGLEAVRIFAAAMDAVVHAAFDAVAQTVPEAAGQVALAAQGGFGAGEQAPQSDVDILFLKSETAGEEADRLIERVLYVLWDLGVDVGGGAARTLQQTLDLAAEDLSEKTALLSLRHIAGAAPLTALLRRRFTAEISAGHEADFVEDKLVERDKRIQKAGASRFTVEPNIKNGKGGLRDLQLLRWLAQFLYGEDAFERWVTDGLLTVGDVEKYLSAADFLWTVRFHLHSISPVKEDRLSFEVQPEIAARMGFEDTENERGVERFMRRYFTTAMDVGALTRLVCAKLEADAWKATPKRLARFLPGEAAVAGLEDPDFEVREGRLAFADAGRIAAEPVLMMRIFERASGLHIDLHPEAMAAIGRNLRLVDESFREDPRAARAFFAVLLDSDTPHAILRIMTEAGLLGGFIPEFGDIVARTQFNMYHRFTVDEHTLQAIGLLREIEQGEHARDHPLASSFIDEIDSRRALHLAVLLHDTGKGAGDQCIEGAERARTACPRLGLDDEETELVAWLIANHLLMSETAQRRDLGDPRTVADFARAVGSLERLRLLAVLTVVDIRSVGPGVWNDWKGQLLRDLFKATEAVLAGGAEAGDEAAQATLKARADISRARLLEKVGRVDRDLAERWTQELDDAYWLIFTEADRLRHAAFARAFVARGEEIAAAVRVDKRRAAAEVMVIAPDREQLFGDLAAALAGLGADIVGAHIETMRSGQAFDIFFIQDLAGQPFGAGDPDRLDALIEEIRAVAAGARKPRARPRAPLKRREAAFRVLPEVKLRNDVADTATLIEASGRDRPSLLADLAEVIASHGLVLKSARIDGYGERVVDVFYVTYQGEKLEDEEMIAAVREGVAEVFGADEAAHAEKAAERGLARADASSLR
jgi:[protein-PII] uridylyltransferase